jgi:hypothetical protein
VDFGRRGFEAGRKVTDMADQTSVVYVVFRDMRRNLDLIYFGWKLKSRGAQPRGEGIW